VTIRSTCYQLMMQMPDAPVLAQDDTRFLLQGMRHVPSERAGCSMVYNGSLKTSVTVEHDNGSKDTLEVHFKLSCDHKLATFVGGIGGAGTSLLCFPSPWNRNDPFGEHLQRTEEDIQRAQAWAEEYPNPIQEACSEVFTQLFCVRSTMTVHMSVQVAGLDTD
jgi:hypothetical protein